ncbi:MAG: hypothetical protein AVDCRST_MAG65-1322, partial [uncultured Solirubrobacteraceae bacterium]
GQAQPQARSRGARRARERVLRRRRQPARPARRDVARHSPPVRRGAGGLAALARGRLAARGRVPLRAPRGPLDHRGHRSDRAAPRAAGALPPRLPGRAPLRARLAAHTPGRALPGARAPV